MEKSLWTGRAGVGRIFLLLLLSVVLYYVVRILRPVLSGLVWAAVLATVFYPVYQRALRYLRRRELAGVVTTLLLTVAIVLPVLFMVFLIAGESVKAYGALENLIAGGALAKLVALRHSSTYQAVAARLAELGLPKPNLSATLIQVIHAASSFLVSHSTSIVTGFMSFALQFFIMLFSIYYLFLHGPQILAELRSLLPLRPEYEEQIIEKFRGVARATFSGSLVIALIQGAVGGLGFLAFGLPAPLVWGAAMAFFSLVPVVGTGVVWVPVVIFYALTGSVMKGLLMLLVFGGVVGSVDNILKPKLIQRGMEIHTLWVFISIIGGVSVFGFLGFVLGPFLFTVLVTLIEIYRVEFGRESPEASGA